MRRLVLLGVALLAGGVLRAPGSGNAATTPTPEPVTATIRQLREKFAGTTFPGHGGHRGVGARDHQRLRREFLPHVLHRRGRGGNRSHGGHRPPAQRFPGGLPCHAQAQGPWRWAKATGYCRPGGCRRRKRFHDRLHRVESGAGRGGDPQRGGAGTHSPTCCRPAN